uniref:Double WAP domain-containing protein n=1 Tax=Penaeus chinensis TaxID=139456 RepID=D7NVB9_PENCE|nr:double WAP domain-containing protein [Penaeus chinensis]
MKIVLLLALALPMVVATRGPLKPGCPNPNQGRQCLLYRDQCQTDFDCEREGKGDICCPINGCGKECVTLHMNARCPDPGSYGLNCFAYIHQCNIDRQCRGKQKCCLVAGCGRSCQSV